ncbi:MAG: hypothetical protein ACLQFM_13480 [Terriglobales bacterium]
MRCLSAGIWVLLVGVCLAADAPPPPAPTLAPTPAIELCSNTARGPACPGSAKDLKAARQAFARGMKLEKSHNLDEALYEFEAAATLVPQNVEYITAQEITRQHVAGAHLEKGNNDLLNGRQVEAMAEFRSALFLDPQNEFALQRIRDALGPGPAHAPEPPQVVASADAIIAKPIDGRHDFHYRGDSRGLLSAVAASYGLTVVFDDSFISRRVRFDLENVDFGTAISAASQMTKSFVVPLEDTVLYAAADTTENHRFFDRMGMRSFYIPGGSSTQELTELTNSLRALFDFKFANVNAAASMITLRGPLSALTAATQFLGQLNSPRPEVMLDFRVFQVSHSYARMIGLHVPDTFTLYNIPEAALAALAGQNIQSLINQLISGGGINQAGNQTIAALIAQLQSQQNSIFSQPLATFGGGLTFFGLSLDMLAPVLSMNESSVKQLEHVQLRADQEKEATFKLGQRYPILNASFAPIYNNTAIAGVLGNQSYTAPFPSVNYEDIGLTIKAKPVVHINSDVALDLEVQFRSLGTSVTNGIPDILNRETKGAILVKNGEEALVAGMVSESEQKSLNGLPLFSTIPGLGLLTAQHSKQESDDELLIVITPYVVRSPERAETPEIWIGK